MNFRIRYKQARGLHEAEAVVEANSPTEALVKFRCIRGGRTSAPLQQEQVTSVCPAERTESGH